MKIPLSWIERFAPIGSVRSDGVSDTELAHLYSIHTAEIDEIIAPSIPDRVVVARVKSFTKHPDSEKLNIVIVDAGEWTDRQIVCGAANVRDAAYVPVALPGAVLPGGFAISETTIRGVESRGMICSTDELGLADERAEGIFPLETIWEKSILESMVGMPVASLQLTLPSLGANSEDTIPLSDTVFEIDNKFITNRPDLFSVAGNAREFAAIFRLPLQQYSPAPLPSTEPLKASVETEHVFAYHLLAFDSAPSRPSAFNGVTLMLRQSGLVTKFTHVDVTNAIMTELGQPLHAFDRDKLVGDICVRMARTGESIDAIDGKTYSLCENDIVIADAEGPIAIAGIMGGSRTAVSADTVRVIYESGCFDPVVVRRTSTRIGLRTDALMRYEKSPDPLLAKKALPRIVDYLRYYGYDASPIGCFSYTNDTKIRTVKISCTRDFLERKTGTVFAPGEIEDILGRLGFDVNESNGAYQIGVPSWRATKDVDIPEDIVEEIARIHGYERIEPVPLSGDFTPVQINPSLEIVKRLRRFLSDTWSYEVMTRSFSHPDREAALGYDDAGVGAIHVINAYSEEASLMRRDMIGGLVEAVRNNVRAHPKFSAFEIGKIYIKDGASFHETKKLAGIAVWMDLREIRTVLDKLMANLLPNTETRIAAEAPNIARFVHPNKSGRYETTEGETIMEFGWLHPALAKRFDAPADTWYFEADIATFVRLTENAERRYEPLDRFPGIEREINFVMDTRTNTGDVARTIMEAHPLVREALVTDIYEDESRIGAGKKSVTFGILVRDREKTITDTEALDIQNAVIMSVSSETISLRS